MASIRLNKEEELKLKEAMTYSGILDKSKFIKQLIHERWLAYQTGKTFLERMGTPPKHLLNGPADLSLRSKRKQFVADHIVKRAKRRTK